MSAVPSPRRSYSDAMWNTYITEAIQSGDRVFTDSTEKQAVEQFNIKYVETNKTRDDNDLAMLLLIIHS